MAEQPIQSILDNLHSAVFVVDEKLHIKCMNPSAEMLFHISSKRAHNKSLSELIIEEHEFNDRLERTTQSRHPYTVFDTSLNIHYGNTITVDYMVSPIEYKHNGHFLLLEFISKGNHHKIAHEKNLLDQHDASRNLLRGLAHEIKNPLGGLRGAAQLLERELNEEQKDYTSIIIKEADRLQTLVDRMLGPKELPDKSSINIHQVLEHVRQLVIAENSAVNIIADYDPSLPDLNADESMLIQSVLNITRNAVSAITDNEITDGKIIYRTRSVRKCAIGSITYPLAVRVDIIDNGAGIPDEIKEQIFFPMITGRANGTGLGLSIAQSLIHRHNGLIECTSNSSETIFTILLPLENGHDK